MNMFGPGVSLLYENREEMLKSAKRIADIGEQMIYFGHGRPVENRRWVK
jgi:hydroxyacylglutathione hydrolase